MRLNTTPAWWVVQQWHAFFQKGSIPWVQTDFLKHNWTGMMYRQKLLVLQLSDFVILEESVKWSAILCKWSSIPDCVQFPSDILYQPSTKTNDSQWGAQPIYQLTHERPSFEARARLLEGLLVILKYSTQDSINLFLLTIRNPQLQVTDLLQALNELFERCRCDEIAETISTCQCMMSSLSFEDMLSLSNCLTMGRSPENSERSSPRHRSVSAGVSLLPSESSPISAYSALSTNQVTITSQQLSIANESMKPTNGNYAVIQQTTMVYPINDCQTQSILPPQKKLESQVWHDKLLPQPFKTTAVLGSSQLDRLDKRVYDVPLLDPQNDFSTYCLDLRNSGRRALARGISLNRLSYWGKMDCELLFRDRVAQDDWNIPNWACEVGLTRSWRFRS